MIACPECGEAAPPGVVLGATYECPSCRNPVLARALPPPPPDSTPVPAAPRAFPWRAAVAAFVVLGGAYVGVYALLTAEANRERAAIEREHGAALAAATDPGEQPQKADAEAMRRWMARRDAFEARRRHEKLGSRNDVFFYALLAAFGAQTAFTALLALKARRAKASARPPGRTRRA